MHGDGQSGDIDYAAMAVESLLSDSNLIAVVLDHEMYVRWVSPSAEPFGLAPVGRSAVELVHADDLDRIAAAFDTTSAPEDFRSTLLNNVVIPVRVVTPTRLVPFEAFGKWLRGSDASWYFVVALVDVTTRFATTQALRRLAGEVDDRIVAQMLVDASRSFGGIDGSQVVWWTSAGETRTLGDRGSDANVFARLGVTDPELGPDGRRVELAGSDWAHVFPVAGGADMLGLFYFWGRGQPPQVRYLAVVVAPLLDLAALALARSRAQMALAELAVTDPVSGLLNRRGFLDQFPVRPDELVAVMYIDLDGFKQVNDSWGHSVGDRVLALAGRRLLQVLSRADAVARIGGDEFAVLCRWIRAESAESIGRRVLDALNSSYDIDGLVVSTGASLGLTVGTCRSSGPELLDRADRALLVAKAEGKARMSVA